MSRENAPEKTVVTATLRWNVPLSEALASKVREMLFSISNELLDRDEAHSVAMTGHELLENVVKYSTVGTSSFELQIVERGAEAHVCFRTRNHTTTEHGNNARQLVQRIAAASDPVTVYDELVAGSPSRKGSCLGLARLRAEADMQVACTEEQDVISIVAEKRVALRRSSQ
jgi:hypothetical protein